MVNKSFQNGIFYKRRVGVGDILCHVCNDVDCGLIYDRK